jgi:hypothetical protein
MKAGRNGDLYAEGDVRTAGGEGMGGGVGFHVGILDRGYRNRGARQFFAGTKTMVRAKLTRIMSGDEDELFGEWVSLGGWVPVSERARALGLNERTGYMCG